MASDRVWSVITLVPVGYCEFCYIADACLTVSGRHPTTLNGCRNWRNVHGPPRNGQKEKALLPGFHERLDQLADAVQKLVTPAVRTHGNTGTKRRQQVLPTCLACGSGRGSCGGRCSGNSGSGGAAAVVDDVESHACASSLSEGSSVYLGRGPMAPSFFRFRSFFERLLCVCIFFCFVTYFTWRTYKGFIFPVR